MYVAVVYALMLVFPLLSIIVELLVSDHGPVSMNLIMALIGKWLVFWAVGVRLVLAGLRQISQPSYTAGKLLGIKDPASHMLVRELGFANTSIGIIGIFSLFATSWTVPAAVAGCIFYWLAGVNHVLRGHRNKLENVAMTSDLLAGAVLLGYLGWVLMR